MNVFKKYVHLLSFSFLKKFLHFNCSNNKEWVNNLRIFCSIFEKIQSTITCGFVTCCCCCFDFCSSRQVLIKFEFLTNRLLFDGIGVEVRAGR